MKRFSFILGALAIAACGDAKPAETVARGKNYAFPIPAGWELTAGAPPGGVAIKEKAPPSGDAFLGSIVVAPLPLKPGADVANDKLCRQLAALIAGQLKIALKGSAIVDGPSGRTCQFDIQGEDQHAALATIVRSPAPAADTWMVTCNHDPHDDGAVNACGDVLATWRFTAR